MRTFAVLTGVLLGAVLLGACRESQRDYEDFILENEGSTYCAQFDVVGLGADSDRPAPRRDICRAPGLRREDYIGEESATSEFHLAEDMLVRCLWSGVIDPGVTVPLEHASAKCSDYSEVLERQSVIDPYEGWDSSSDREILGNSTTCFVRESDSDIVDESCFTDEGVLVFLSRITSDGGSTEIATSLSTDVPDTTFVLPDNVDDRTGQPLLDEQP